ncbi:MAG: MBL fold metallo-hydrolase [Nitrososphaerota archaeon]
MEITFLGSVGEVGKSAILIKAGGARILLDYGIKPNDEPGFPAHVAPKDLDAVIITHAHLDHSGAVPLLYMDEGPKLYATSMSLETCEILLEDFLRLSGYYIPYEYLEVEYMLERAKRVYYREPIRVKDVEIELLDAGHIPGSAQVVINADKRVLFTGDMNPIKTRLLSGADTGQTDVDAVITESTYAKEMHEDRQELEKRFVEECNRVVKDGGIVLVPAFSVGRSQEILCVLTAQNFKHSLSTDGMAVKLLDLYLNNREFIADYNLLEKASRRVNIVSGKRERKRVLEQPGVIVCPAGMLKGGPAAYYAQHIAEDEVSAIFLVSYQIPGTPGASLISEKKLIVNGKERPVKAMVKHFLFSSHAGQKELHSFLRSFNPGTKVFTVHGDADSCEVLAKWAKENCSLDAIAPSLGMSYEL